MGMTLVGDVATSQAVAKQASGAEAEQRPGRARASANYGQMSVPRPEDSSDALPELPRSKAPLYLGITVGVLLVLGLVALGVVALVSGGPEVSAAVVQSESGEQLQITVPGAEEGTRVRLGTQEAPLSAGSASLPLSSDALHVGANELTLTLVGADGETEEVPLTLMVGYRLRADLSALEESPPVLRYTVEAQPGTTVLMDGHPVELDAAGRGHHDYPIEASEEDEAIERIVRYQVQAPDMAPESGLVTTSVPYTSLQVDRPGDTLVTDLESVEVAGRVDEGASVTLNGEPLVVREGRFLQRFPLPEVQEYRIQLDVRRPGFAPRRRELTVRRVADLAAEAARYTIDRSLTYARIAQNPAIYTGQSMALEGRVYHVDVHEGRSVLQMMVRDCGGGQRCAAWVTYPAATDATVGSWVRVLGEVAGEQAFRPRSGGAVMTVPRVDARFVLPLR